MFNREDRTVKRLNRKKEQLENEINYLKLIHMLIQDISNMEKRVRALNIIEYKGNEYQFPAQYRGH